MHISLFFLLSILLILLKHGKLIVKWELLFGKVMWGGASAFNQKAATHLVACWKKRTDDPRGESTTEDPEEEPIPITEDSKRTLPLSTLKKTLSLRNLKRRTLSQWNSKKSFQWVP